MEAATTGRPGSSLAQLLDNIVASLGRLCRMLLQDMCLKQTIAADLPFCSQKDTLSNYACAFTQAPFMEQATARKCVARLKGDVALLLRDM